MITDQEKHFQNFRTPVFESEKQGSNSELYAAVS